MTLSPSLERIRHGRIWRTIYIIRATAVVVIIITTATNAAVVTVAATTLT